MRTRRVFRGVAMLALALALAAVSAAPAWAYTRASETPAQSGWGYSLSTDGSGYTRKWAYAGPGQWLFGWRPDWHQIYITPFGISGWSWTWCTCNGGTWSAAYTRDLVFS